MFIDSKTLDSKTPDIKCQNSNIYFLSEYYLIKKFLTNHSNIMKRHLSRYEKAKQMGQIEGLVTPIDILETENGFSGYIEPIIPGTLSNQITQFSEIVNERRHTITIDEIAEYFLKCKKIIDNCNKNGIINPDMCSSGNVLYNKLTKQVSFVDYNDMQVGTICSESYSSFLSSKNPILETKKYFDGEMYTKNLDIYSLTIRAFYYMTKINLPRAIGSYDINELLKLANMQQTTFGDCVRVLYDPNRNNLDITEPLNELCKEYKLATFIPGQVRKIAKK